MFLSRKIRHVLATAIPAFMVFGGSASAETRPDQAAPSDSSPVSLEGILYLGEGAFCPKNLEPLLGEKCLYAQRRPNVELDLGWDNWPVKGEWSSRLSLETLNTDGNDFADWSDRGVRFDEFNLSYSRNGETTFTLGLLPRTDSYYITERARPFGETPNLADEGFYLLSLRGLIGLRVSHDRNLSYHDEAKTLPKWSLQARGSIGRTFDGVNDAWGQKNVSYTTLFSDGLERDLGNTWDPSLIGQAGLTRIFNDGKSYFRFGLTGSRLAAGKHKMPNFDVESQIQRFLLEERDEIGGIIKSRGAEFIPPLLQDRTRVERILLLPETQAALQEKLGGAIDVYDLVANNLEAAVRLVQSNSAFAVEFMTENPDVVLEYFDENPAEVRRLIEEFPEIKNLVLEEVPLLVKDLTDEYRVGAFAHWHQELPWKVGFDLIGEGAYLWNATGERNLDMPTATIYGQATKIFNIASHPVGLHTEAGIHLDSRGFVASSVGGGVHVPLVSCFTAHASATYNHIVYGFIPLTGDGYTWKAGLECRFSLGRDKRPERRHTHHIAPPQRQQHAALHRDGF